MEASPSTEEAQEEPFRLDDLPPALLLTVVQKIPTLVERVRCALISKAFAALLAEPAFWAELDFAGAREEHLSDNLVLNLARRARGQLRFLDVTSREAIHRITELSGEKPLYSVLAAEGLTARLERLESLLWVYDEDIARRLSTAFPALREAGVAVPAGWANARDALRVLRCDRVGEVNLFQQDPFPLAGSLGVVRASFLHFAAAATEALSLAAIDTLTIGLNIRIDVDDPRGSAPGAPAATAAADDDDGTSGGDSGAGTSGGGKASPLPSPAEVAARAAAAEAAAALGRAMADPARGPLSLHGRGSEATDEEGPGPAAAAPFAAGGIPAFVELCGALTQRSRLRHLTLKGPTWARGRPAAALAGLLGDASGRCGVRSLELYGGDIFGRCSGLPVLAALAANASLTALHLHRCKLGPESTAALAAALRANRSLRELRLQVVTFNYEPLHFLIPDEFGAVLAALGSGAEGGGCLIEVLEIDNAIVDAAAAAALGAALRRGAPLRRLVLRNGSPAAGTLAVAEEVAGALRALGGRARLAELELCECNVGDAGAEALARALRDPACPLESLTLGDCHIGSRGGLALAQAVRENPATRIRELLLPDNGGLGPEAARAVAAAVLGAAAAQHRK